MNAPKIVRYYKCGNPKCPDRKPGKATRYSVTDAEICVCPGCKGDLVLDHAIPLAGATKRPDGTVGFDASCSCGWPLPVSVIPVRLSGATAGVVDGELEDHVQPDAFVALQCPECHRGHAFYMPHVATKAGRAVVDACIAPKGGGR
jgi:hypothetical protein